MSKNPKSFADRLILLVARLGERATVQNITGRHLVGVEFEQAKQDAKAHVVWEQIHQMRQRRPAWGAQRSRKASTTARLTKAGIWRAAALGVPYSPGLVDALIAESEKPAPHSRAEKQREAETAALVADGKEYRRQIAARKTAKDEAAKATLVGPRRKRSARHYEKLNKFLVSRGMQPTKVSAFGNGLTLRQSDAKIPSPASAAPASRSIAPPAEHRVQVTPATRARTFADDLAAIQGSQLVGFGEPVRGFDNNPKPQVRTPQGESRSEVVIRAKASGHFFDGAFHTTDNQVVSWQEWAAWAPK
jgi:hypothetical protein